jgi:glycosyltransferase involved in cell wall biosynthesis
MQRPLISIGVPVYNGERYLAHAIDSLLAQTLSDFELIISDNASTDGTRAICEDYAQRDRRLRYIRQERNIGAPRNWNAVVHEARGIFFKWATANDHWAPLMLEQCVEALQTCPDVVLCYGLTQPIDEHGQPMVSEVIEKGFDEDSPSERFARVSALLVLNNAQCGLYRLDALRRTGLDRLYPSGDLALMAELSLYGKFRLISHVHLYRRQSRSTFSSMRTPIELHRFYNPDARTPMRIIRGRRHLDHIVSISRAPISVAEKVRAYRVALRLARWDRGRLWRELLSLFGASRHTA